MTASHLHQDTVIAGGGSLNGNVLVAPGMDSRLPLDGKLVGRDRQLNLLERRYQERKQQHREQSTELLIITGESGTGKSTLARSLGPTVERDGGYFLASKCNPDHQPSASSSKRHQRLSRSLIGSPPKTPYAPFVAAFSQFVDQVIARGEVAIQQVRDAIKEESDSDLLVDMIPDFRKLLQPASDFSSSVSATSNQTTTRRRSSFWRRQPDERQLEQRQRLVRKNHCPDAVISPNVLVLTRFLVEFCSGGSRDRENIQHRENALVIVLDDVQWIDQPSLDLIKVLLTEKALCHGLTLIATCRGNEVERSDPLSVMLRELESSLGVAVHDIPLHNLGEEEVDQIVADMLQLPLEEVGRLSSLIYEETEGNPFSVLQLIRAMHEKRLLSTVTVGVDSQDPTNSTSGAGGRRWQWDMDDIREALQNLDCRNIDVLSSRIEHVSLISDPLHRVLRVAACMGSQFEVAHLELTLAEGGPRVRGLKSALAVLQEKQFIRPTKNDKEYCWAHDRFQKAAYNLIPRGEQQQLHRRIGLRLLYNLSAAEVEKYVFLVANQLLCVNPDLLEREEKYEVVLLCVLAGQKAAQSSAFESAGYYFNLGIRYFNMDVGLLEEHRWTRQYDLKLGLYNATAEMECCMGKFEEVDELVGHIIDHARCFEDKLRAYETQIYSLCARHELARAVDSGLYVLRRLGEEFSVVNVDPRLVGREMSNCRRLLSGKSDDYILGLRPSRDWKKVNAIRVMQLLFPPILQSQPHLAPLFATRVVQITLEYGLTPMSCAGFAVLGTVLCYPAFGLYEEGNRYAQLGLRIMEKFEVSEMKCRVLFSANAFCTPYVQPIRDCLGSLAAGAQAGLSSGDIEMSCSSLFLISLGSFFAGDRLEEVLDLLSKYQQRATALQQHKILSFMAFATQMILNLIGRARDFLILSGEACDEEKMMDDFEESGNVRAIQTVELCKCFLAMYDGNYEVSRALLLKIKACKKTGLNALCMIQMVFLDAMTDVTIQHPTKHKALQAGKAPLKRLTEYAKLCPENVTNKVCLIEAERFAIRGQSEKAIVKFQQSIEHAEKQGLIQEQALACERVGLLLIEWGKDAPGNEYLRKARQLYGRWGARYKVDKMSWLDTSGNRRYDEKSETSSARNHTAEMLQ